MRAKIIALSTVEEIYLREDVYIFDVNPEWYYVKHHIPMSVHLPVPFSVTQLPQDEPSMIIFYSKNARCTLSHVAAVHSLRMGYKNIWLMKAGMEGWICKNLPIAGKESNGFPASKALRSKKTIL